MKLTDQQRNGLKMAIQQDHPMLIFAAAGSGKSTFLKLVAKELKHMNWLCVVFNRHNKIEARRNFPKNTFVHSTHSLCYELMEMKKYRHKLDGKRFDYFSLIAGFRKSLRDPKFLPFSDYQIVQIARSSVLSYERSTAINFSLCDFRDTYQDVFYMIRFVYAYTISGLEEKSASLISYLQEQSFAYGKKYFEMFLDRSKKVMKDKNGSLLNLFLSLPKDFITHLKTAIEINLGKTDKNSNTYASDIDLLTKYLHSLASRLWEKSSDLESDVPMGHDSYIKLFYLSGRSIEGYDGILYDEYQDANEIFVKIIERQSNLRKIIVGDHHQSIYQFRGAVNAIPNLLDKGYEICPLTTSFRFGDKIAEIANRVLDLKKSKIKNYDERLSLRVNGFKEVEYDSEKRPTILCRTNADVIQKTIEIGIEASEKIYIGGSIDRSFLDRLYDIIYLAVGEKDKIRSSYIQSFEELKDLKEESDLKSDSEISRAITITTAILQDKDYKAVMDFLEGSLSQNDPKSYHILTSHKAKGSQWNHVHISDDFAKYFYKLNPDGSLRKELKS
ncbi:MAG: UvrD-helicase domain-containing protein [Pseudobacteriovorax sp.]|nr:UvrD-helicase domain-containing protein [Pseudobacteriovorax sp.]